MTELRKDYYNSRTAGRMTGVNVLLPEGYDGGKQYPALYFLHGYWGTEDSLVSDVWNLVPLYNRLYETGKAPAMVLVFPYLYCSREKPVCTALDLENSLNYDRFIEDLTFDLIPYIEKTYRVIPEREKRAISGFSMGGRESLFIGLTRSDLFGTVGAVCPAPGLTPGADLSFHPGQLQEEKLKFAKGHEPSSVFLSAAVNDPIVGRIPYHYHDLLTANGVAHTWQTIPDGAHDPVSVHTHFESLCALLLENF